MTFLSSAIENSSSFPSVRLLLNTTELTDMGTFNCTATSSGVATSSMVQIVVKGKILVSMRSTFPKHLVNSPNKFV